MAAILKKCLSVAAGDEENVLLGPLIEFEVAAGQALICDYRQIGADADRAVMKGVVMPAIGVFADRIAKGIGEHTARGQQLAESGYYRLLLIQRQMKNAVPGKNEIESLRGLPLADIGLMKNRVRVMLPCQPYHFDRHIEAGYRKALFIHQTNEAAAGTTTDIESFATCTAEFQSPGNLLHAILRINVLLMPPNRDLVVFFAQFFWVHAAFSLKISYNHFSPDSSQKIIQT